MISHKSPPQISPPHPRIRPLSLCAALALTLLSACQSPNSGLSTPAADATARDGGDPAPAPELCLETTPEDAPQPGVTFEIPCADILTPEFIASLQRALAARGYYAGDITGQINAATSAAIAQFQSDQNDILTDTLTLRTARTLGLVAVPRDPL